MATSNTQRYAILVILVVTVIGTMGSFAVLILDNENRSTESAQQKDALNAYQEATKAHDAKVQAQAAKLSDEYYATFSGYASRVAAFDRESVKDLSLEDLVVGTGEEITGTTKFAAYYIGWNPKAKIFDQSIDGATLKEPIYYSKPAQGFVGLDQGLDKATLIEGWKEGMKGMKIGGVREITIPSDKAYGEQGQGDDIPSNTPIKFVVMAIPALPEIAQPEIPASLYQGMQ